MQSMPKWLAIIVGICNVLYPACAAARLDRRLARRANDLKLGAALVGSSPRRHCCSPACWAGATVMTISDLLHLHVFPMPLH